MTNIAQTVNVLQSLILTEGPRMILTPTYHAFDMYKVHHDAVKLPVYVESETTNQGGEMPLISASASMDDENRIHVSVTNIDPAHEQELKVELRGLTLSPSVAVRGKIISSEHIQDHNTFEEGDKVTLKEFSGAALCGSAVKVRLPAKSLVTLELE
jgi:alpha-N-arabinofuranosidase